jgi:anti-sigma regulatory factor (Ser/Thr protein kinase)
MSEGTAHGEFAVRLPFGPDAARVARSMVGRLLTEHECDGRLVEDGRLVVHELVMNGVTHGEPDARAEIAVSCRLLESHVVISVLDQGRRGTVVARRASADSIDGRGLAIVEALSERWSVDRNGGTRVEAWLSR